MERYLISFQTNVMERTCHYLKSYLPYCIEEVQSPDLPTRYVTIRHVYIQDLRVILNFIVVYGHAFSFIPTINEQLPNIILENINKGTELVITFLTVIISSIFLYAVDIFLLISGFLLAHAFCRKVPDEKYTWRHGIHYLINRFLRLFPVHAISWAVASARGRNVCTQPSIVCEFFHLLNFNPDFGKVPFFSVSCLVHGWSLSADFQGHIFIVLVLILLKSRQRTFQVLFVTNIAIVLKRMYFVYQLGRPIVRITSPGATLMTFAASQQVLSNVVQVFGVPAGNFSLSANDEKYNLLMRNDFKLYNSPHLRVAPVFIEFMTWYAMQRQMAIVRWINRNVSVVLLMSLFTNFSVFVSALVVAELNGSVLWVDILFDGLHRFIFTTSSAAFIIAIGHTCNADKSSIVRIAQAICSKKLVKWIASLSYAIYLMHLYLQGIAANMSPRFSLEQFKMWRLAVSAIQVYALSMLLAVLCHYLETRFHNMVSSGRVSHTSEEATEKED